MKRYLIPILILIFGLFYVFLLPASIGEWKIVFKLIPMFLIIYYAIIQIPKGKTSTHTLIIVGLLFSTLGDGTLRWFVFGLSAFLIGHLFYIAGFFKEWKFSKTHMLTIIPLAIYSVWIGRALLTGLHESNQEALTIPVIMYIIVISIMAFIAIMTRNVWVMIGSILFVISDSVLAWNKFITDVSFSHQWIMFTYYSAQFFIAHSLKTIVVKDKK